MTETFPEIWHSPSERVTQELAARFAERLRGGGHVALEGDLGAGKTCFAKGVIAALTGVQADDIPSPTFTLVEEYPGPVKVYHVDLYRMNHPAEAEDLAWDEILAPDAVALVEWAERLPKIIEDCQFRLLFSKEGKKGRRIELLAKGNVHDRL